MPKSVQVLVHAVRSPQERAAHLLLLRWLQRDGWTIDFTVWDRGMVDLDLEQFGPVGDIETINRWRLPIHLARVPTLRPIARFLRSRRVRRWWRRAHRPRLALLLGPIRPEMRHYVAPSVRRITAVVGLRPPEPADDPALTRELAHVLVDLDDGPLVVVRPAWPEQSPERRRLSDRLGIASDALVVGGVGRTDWRGGTDLFLRMAARLQQQAPDLNLHFAWIGGLADGPEVLPYHFDARRLGLDDRLQWLGDPPDHTGLLRRLDAVALVGRHAVELPQETGLEALDTPCILRSLDVPMAAFDLPWSESVRDAATTVRYPDVAAMATALEEGLRHPRTGRATEHFAMLVGATT